MLMSVPEIAGYLDRHEITITESGGRADFNRPEWMDATDFRNHVAYLVPHIKPVRRMLLEYLTSGGGHSWRDTTKPVDWRAERKRIVVDFVRQRAENGGRIGGFDYYTRRTKYLPAN